MDTMRRVRYFMISLGFIGFTLVASGCGDSSEDAPVQDHSLRGLLANDLGNSKQNSDHFYPTIINTPPGTPRLSTGEFDAFGQPITVSCSTCHTLREPNVQNAATSDLNEFHQGLTFAHNNGQVSCLSCHNSDDYDTLKLANGTAIDFTDVMTLCSQCHGPKYRDYTNGAHGGMNGYWDLNKGARTRNNCVDCHDPHAPAFPHMMPTFKPLDRFLKSLHSDDQGQSTSEHAAEIHDSENHED